MEQNINLLERPLVSASQRYASLKSFALIISGFFALLMLIYFISLGVYKKEEAQLARLVLERKNVSKQINVLMRKIAQQNAAAPLSSAVAVAGQPAGQFVPYLEKLGTYTPYGIWLDSFSFSQKENGFAFILHGKAIATTLLPQFMKIIDRQSIFNGEKFISLAFQKNERTNLVSFTLNNSKSQTR